MMQKSNRLISFLEASKSYLLNITKGKFETLRIIIGNETSDMDSTFGSILLAYLYSHMNTDPGVQIVPLMNKQRNYFKSSFELTYLLEKQYDIPINHLVFLDQIDINQINANYKMELILYDHNLLNSNWKLYTNNVVEILDHHEDKSAQLYPKLRQKQIELIGSACTLVGEKIKQQSPDQIDQIVSNMILSTVTLDTFNFEPKLQNNRWIQRDKDIIEYYQQFCPNFNCDLYYKQINELKYSKEMNFAMEMESLILKDYKQFKYPKGSVGFAIIFLRLETLYEKYSKDELISLWKGHMNSQSLDLFIIMFVHLEQGDKLERDLLILKSISNGKSYYFSLLSDEIQKLQVEKLEFESNDAIYYKDTFALYTRKIIEPLVAKVLQQ